MGEGAATARGRASGRFVWAEDVVARRIGSEVILAPIRRRQDDPERVFTLNEVAARVWDLCDGTRQVDDIAAALAGEYEVGARKAARDVRTFLDQMREAGLLKEITRAVLPRAD